MSPLATIEPEQLAEITIVGVRGEIDVSNGEAVQTAILDSVTLETRCVVLDLSGVRYFDSVGVRLSFDVEQRLSRHGIAFGIVRPARSYVRKVLELCGAEHVIALDVAYGELDWQLRNDQKAAKTFVGKDCGLCTDPAWSVEKKKIG